MQKFLHLLISLESSKKNYLYLIILSGKYCIFLYVWYND